MGEGEFPERTNIFAAISMATAIFVAKKGYRNSMVRGGGGGGGGGGEGGGGGQHSSLV